MLDLNEWLPIADFSNDTLLIVAQRLEDTTSRRQSFAREAELDDLWRYVEAAIDTAVRQESDSGMIDGLRMLFSAVTDAHDLAGAGRTREAGTRIRQALVAGFAEPRGAN